jgi:hypothetical protein
MVRRGGSASPASVSQGRDRCGDRPLIDRCAMLRGDEWRPRMDLHHQPPDSKSGALLVELQGCMKMVPGVGIEPTAFSL